MGGDEDSSRPIAVIDTCSIILLKQLRKEDQTVAYRGLKKLVLSGKLVYPQQVLDELKAYGGPSSKMDKALEWAENNRQQATRFEVNLLGMQQQVLAQVPRILDYDKPSAREEADPYLLQLGLQLQSEGYQVTIITQESKDTPRKMSLSTACGRLRLVCLPVLAYLEEQGICSIAYSLGPPGTKAP